MIPDFYLDHLELRYEPFPIGIARPIFSDGFYAELLASYPPIERFATYDDVGTKYTLSEKHNPRDYKHWIQDHPAWRDFHAWVKSKDFIATVLGVLRARNIDLGVKFDAGPFARGYTRLRAILEGGTAFKVARLSTRFEFSMMPANGGCILPHTDNASKLVTLVVSMADPLEWKPSYGGGTEVSRPKDPTRIFNRTNRQLGFDEVEKIAEYPFEPNQALLFVKTFNSWHCVRPMQVPDSKLMRRTLTVNIETPD
jgi:hypothetical protein